MAEMVFLQCDIGSRAVYVACPKCGRISRQILRDEYNGGSVALLAKELTCPVCGSVYRACSTSRTREWSAAFSRYNLNGNAYNSAVRDNYARQQDQKNNNAKYTPLESWKDIFKLSVLKPGETIARKGLVRDLLITTDSFTANVQGEDLYQVRIDIKNQGVAAAKCTCPIGTTGLCKHMAAVLFVTVDGVQKETSEVKTLTERVFACFVDAKELLSLAQIDTFANLYFCAKLISILADAPYMETEWFDLRINADVLPLLEDACNRCEMLENKTARLLEKWESGILAVAVDEMLARFKTEYSGLFYKFKGSYKEDIHLPSCGYSILLKRSWSLKRLPGNVMSNTLWSGEVL